MSPWFAVTLHYYERPGMCRERFCASPLGTEDYSTITDLDGDFRGPDASGKTQENRNGSSKTHVSDR